MKKLILLVVLSVYFCNADAQVSNEHYYNYINGNTVRIDSGFVVVDDKLDSPVWPFIVSNNSVDNTAALYVDFSSAVVIPEKFYLKLEVEMTAWDSSGTQVEDTISFEVDYDSANIPMSHMSDIYYFNDYHKMQLRIIGITYEQNDTVYDPEDLPEFFKLSASIDIERVYAFDCENDMTVVHLPGTYYNVLLWAAYTGATDYDIEWTFYGNESKLGQEILGSSPPTDSELPGLFLNNATRVNVKSVLYYIPKIYPDGFLFIRIRPAATLSPTDRAVGAWQYHCTNHTPSVMMDAISWHEPYFNFKYDAVYAEEGKMAETVSYFDGALLNRQVVNRFEREASGTYTSPLLVSEIIYDHLGRPAVNVLPVPPPEKDAPVQYFDVFNRNLGGNAYNFYDFETGGCGTPPDEMNSSYGAANYYSTNNSYKSTFDEKTLPDAEGYPFTVKEYTPDNTGRVSRMSNVGEKLALGTGHETKYFYGKPSQDELDYIFGNDAGDYLRYTKEMVVDPNNTTSITLKDAHNRVVATALAGALPDCFEDITRPDLYPDPVQEGFLNTVNAFANANFNGTTITSNTVVLLAEASDIVIDFSLEGDTVNSGCDELTDRCYDCLYDIHLVVTGACEDDLLVDEWLHNYSFETGFPSTCDGLPDAATFTTTLSGRPAGSYNISCEIQVSEQALAAYKEIFLQNNLCVSLEEMMSTAAANVDITGCYNNCAECKDALGTLEEFTDKYLDKMDLANIPIGDEETLEEEIESLYNQLLADCDDLCGVVNVCHETLLQMKSDVSPGGQYALYEYNDDGDFSASDPTSIFFTGTTPGTYPAPYTYSGLVYHDEDGTTVTDFEIDGVHYTPNQLSPADFIDKWKESWADELVKLHPEYCYSLFCDEDANNYEMEMLSVDTWDEAGGGLDGYFDPLNPLSAHPDPFYINNLSAHASLMSDFYDELHEYISGSYTSPFSPYPTCTLPSPGSLSIWGIAYLTGASVHNQAAATGFFDCGFMTNDWCWSAINDELGGYGFTICANDKDKAWEVFRSLYLHIRAKYYKILEEEYVTGTCSCTMKCLGCSTTACAGENYNIGYNISEYAGIGQHAASGTPNLVNNNVKDKIPRWLHYDDNASASFTTYGGGNTYTQTSMQAHCQSVCDGYMATWKSQLDGCNYGSGLTLAGSPVTLTEPDFLSYLNDVCMNACDLEHPVGASSFPEDSCDGSIGVDLCSFNIYNFQDVFDETGITQDASCNASLLLSPVSYEMAGEQADMPAVMYDSVPPCVCDRLNMLHDEYCPSCNAEAFHTYLTNTYGEPEFTATQLGAMMGYCDSPGCIDLGDGFQLPQYLNCQTCLSCTDMDTSVHNFTEIYINNGLAATDPVGSIYYFGALTSYLDTIFHTTHTTDEYKEMIKHCGISLFGYNCASYEYLTDLYTSTSAINTIYSTALYFNLQFDTLLSCGDWNTLITGDDRCGITSFDCDALMTVDCNAFSEAIRNYLKFTSDDLTANYSTTGYTATYLTTLINFFKTSYFGTINSNAAYYNQVQTCTGHPPYFDDPQASNFIIYLQQEFGQICFDSPKKFEWLWLAHYPYLNGTYTFALIKAKYDADYIGSCDSYSCNDLDPLILNYNTNSAGANFTVYTNTALSVNFTDNDYDQWIDACEKGYLFEMCTDPSSPTFNFNDNPPCLEQALNNIAAEVELQYSEYIETKVAEFEARYIAKCMHPVVTFTAAHNLHQYHYTLYYYDQAGNLVKTVAPQGVRIFNLFQLDDVRNYRDGFTSTPVFPQHQFDTKYWYNSLNQLVKQWTPDADSTWFWYDELGRIILSQNSKQRPFDQYSYTIYDNLSRVVEVGQLQHVSGDISRTASGSTVNTIIYGSTIKTDVVQTWYDAQKFTSIPLTQKNLRKRIASVTTEAVFDNDDDTYDYATHYTYDMQGNVSELIQENPYLASMGIGEEYKSIVYEYDLVSGKVNKVSYQAGADDQFFYKYQYDSRNRLTGALTSNDDVKYLYDARYKYWRYGPLKRTVLGDLQVQGLDYIYTLQGWLKSLNGAIADTVFDPGNDGRVGSVVAADQYAQALGYFEGDYVSIEGAYQDGGATAGVGMRTSADLFNGNIRYQISSFPQYGVSGDNFCYTTLGYEYRYDMLNRLKRSFTYRDSKFETKEDDYYSHLEYDGNGNITDLERTVVKECSLYTDGFEMDNQQYHYYTGVKMIGGDVQVNWPTNKLSWVDDGVSSSDHSMDIDDQNENNYTYDETGNLIGDNAEYLEIKWNNFNKIDQITCTKPGGEYVINYRYDPMGNRIYKKYNDLVSTNKSETIYVRDAQGNILSTYNWWNSDIYAWKEQYLYGSTRVGAYHPEEVLFDAEAEEYPPYTSSFFQDYKDYEVNDHLGNVMAEVADVRDGYDVVGDSHYDYFTPIPRMLSDYYPFGMQMPGRNYIYSPGYRFGYNGKENDDEVKGNGNSLDYGARIYDPRLGRFLSIDPLEKDFPFYSTYQFAGNRPIWAIDLDGMEDTGYTMQLDKVFSTATGAENHNKVMKNLFYKPVATAMFKGAFKEALPKKMIEHYSNGYGLPLMLNNTEMNDLHVQPVGLTSGLIGKQVNNQIEGMLPGESRHVSFKSPDGLAANTGTLGQFTIIGEGTFTMGDNGKWKFSGTMQFYDSYNFNIETPEEEKKRAVETGYSRSPEGKWQTAVANRYLPGMSYDVYSPEVEITQTSEDDYFSWFEGKLFNVLPNRDTNKSVKPE